MSEPLFDVTVKVTPETCHALAKARAGQHNRIIWLCNAVIALCLCCLWAVRSHHVVWVSILLVLLLLHALLRVRLAAVWMYLARNQTVDQIRMTFSDKGIRVQSRVEKSKLRYDAVTGLREDRRFLMITLQHHTPLVVAKAELPDGRAEALAEYLKEKTGMEIRPFRK